MKNFFGTIKKQLKKASAFLVACALSACMAICCFAADGSGTYDAATAALQSGFSEVATQIVTVAGVAITGGIGIFGLKKLVTAAMGFFSKIVGR